MPALSAPLFIRRRKASGAALSVGLITLVFAAVGIGRPAWAATDISQCRTIDDPTERLRCYESVAPPELQFPPSSSGSISGSMAPLTIGNWRLVRTPNPRGGKEAISIMRPGDLSGSDPDFVGLTIRCAEPDIEVLLVMLRPLPFRARPRVSINGAKFDGSIVPPGLNILLQGDATIVAKQLWPTLSSLSLEIDNAGTITKGAVSLEDFDAALKSLTAACPLRQ